jgi:hypothetical protein
MLSFIALLLAGTETALAETPSFGASTICMRDPTRTNCMSATPTAQPATPPMPVYEGPCVTDRTRPSCESRAASPAAFRSYPAAGNARGNAALGGGAVGFFAGATYGAYYCLPSMWIPGAYGTCVGASALIGTAVGGATGAVIELDKASRANPPARP